MTWKTNLLKVYQTVNSIYQYQRALLSLYASDKLIIYSSNFDCDGHIFINRNFFLSLYFLFTSVILYKLIILLGNQLFNAQEVFISLYNPIKDNSDKNVLITPY